MWKRKTKDEISKEKSSRRIKQAKPLFFIIVIVCSITFYYTKSEYALVAPFCVYMFYRAHVIYGKQSGSTSMLCISCEKSIGNGDDGHGFKVYGNKKKKWYQIKACKTPEKCDIAYLHEVKWIELNNESV